MRGSVRIATGHGHAGLRQALLGRYHVHNPLLARTDMVHGDTSVSRVLLQGLHHLLSEIVGVRTRAGISWNNVIDRGDGSFRKSHFQAALFQHGKGLRRGHLMDHVQTNKELGLTTGQDANGMLIPYLIE